MIKKLLILLIVPVYSFGGNLDIQNSSGLPIFNCTITLKNITQDTTITGIGNIPSNGQYFAIQIPSSQAFITESFNIECLRPGITPSAGRWRATILGTSQFFTVITSNRITGEPLMHAAPPSSNRASIVRILGASASTTNCSSNDLILQYYTEGVTSMSTEILRRVS